jgi:diguanylate cyclase (GGDEF)-like protein/PAS domain S-box-containing protein
VPESTQLSQLIDELPDIVFVVDTVGTLVNVNEAASALLGWSRQEWQGRNVLDLIHPDDLGLVESSMEALMGKRFGTPIEIRVRTATGEWKWLEIVGATLHEGPGILCVARDITRRRVYEVGHGELSQFQQVIQHAASITLLLDRTGRVRSVSGAFTRLLGHDPTRVVGSPLAGFAAGNDRVNLESAVFESLHTGANTHCEALMTTRRGGTRPIRFEIVNLIDDPVVQGLVVTGHEISDLFSARSELHRLAMHDGLTGLANRSALLERLDAVVTWRTPACVVFIDLDRFKPVNDLYGHHIGDDLLVAVAERITRSVRPSDVVARVGGDEFVVLAHGVTDGASAERLSRRIEADLGQAYLLDVGTVRVTASIGFALTDATSTVTGLLADADTAMYDAKTAKRGGTTSGRPFTALQRRELVDDLAAGLEREEIVAYLQPIVDDDTGRAVAFEALARWHHPRLGTLAPAQFLELANEAGLDLALGDAVLASACDTFVSMDIGSDVLLSVNLSVGQLLDRDLPARMQRIARRARMPFHRLVMEITERATLPHPGDGQSGIEAMLLELRAAGASLALDDFGTGFSSLTHVGRFPISAIKIDRSFVEGVLERAEDRAVIAAVVGMSTALELTVVAEGVESPAQLEALRSLGCTTVQGFLLGPPMQAAELNDWCRRHPVAR